MQFYKLMKSKSDVDTFIDTFILVKDGEKVALNPTANNRVMEQGEGDRGRCDGL